MYYTFNNGKYEITIMKSNYILNERKTFDVADQIFIQIC